MRFRLIWFAILSGCAAPSESAPAAARAEAAPALAPAPVAPAPAPAREPAAPTPAPVEPTVPALPSTRGEVVLVPLGDFPDDLVDAVEERLERELAVEVRRHEPVPLPQSAWYAPRKRYRADVLLDHLATLSAPERAHMLGLTQVDISTTKAPHEDWGIFGLGQMPGRTAVVSMYRLKRKTRDREHLRFRVATVALHEAGHTFGLDHCGEARCPMQDAEGSIANTDSSAEGLGPECLGELDAAHPVAR